MWPLEPNRCELLEVCPSPVIMSFTSEQIDVLMNAARGEWHCCILLKISAGSGCTVVEIFDRDAKELSVPIQRIVL